MTYAFLPHAGATWLCLANGPQVTPLAPAPGMNDAIRRFSTDGTEFGFLDQTGKRLGHYKLLEHAPWFERLAPLSTLPTGCTADDFVIHQGAMIAGGKGPNREALWMRRTELEKVWRPVALPEGIGKRGKSIDALFVRGDKLVAVDNVMVPKWILVYPLEPELSCNGVEVIKLRNHTTYESVERATEGDKLYALKSSGINHGRVSHYIALLRKNDLTEIGLWRGFVETRGPHLISESVWDDLILNDVLDADSKPQVPSVESVINKLIGEAELPKDALGDFLSAVQAMAFCGDLLVVAVGARGLYAADASAKAGAQGKRDSASSADFTHVPLQVLSTVTSVQSHKGGCSGLYAIGLDPAGIEAFEWVGANILDCTRK